MKKTLILAVLCGLVASSGANAQTLTFLFRNAQIIPGTPQKFQYEVWIKSSDGTTKMGSVMIYNNYNTTAFGPSVVANGKVAVTKNAAEFGAFYAQNASNDNTASRLVFSWTWPTGGSGLGVAIPATGDGVKAFTVAIDIANPAVNSGLTFDALMDGQQYKDDETTKWPTLDLTNTMDSPLPITLGTFTAKVNPSGPGVRLDWSTVSEVNNYGFYVQRREENSQSFTDIPNSFVAGHGTTLQPQKYSYVDYTMTKAGQYYYRLRQVDLDGTEHFTSALSTEATLLSVREVAPMEFKLMQNYPNPFNPETEIKFSVESTGKTTVSVYNVIGQQVAALFDDVADAGRYYTVRFDGGNLASGIYLFRLQSGNKSDIKKMMLVR